MERACRSVEPARVQDAVPEAAASGRGAAFLRLYFIFPVGCYLRDYLIQ